MKSAARKFFRRSKKSSSEPKAPKKSHHASTHDDLERDKYRAFNSHPDYHNYAVERSSVFAPWLELPSPILERVFAFVCPHSRDESYETCEQSAIEDACMLCDLRDLSHAGRVCKRWRKTAVALMYKSIRIDPVHYCEREIDLSEKRKRRSRFDRNGAPEDTASARLQLLCRTLREDPTRLGKLVRYFKTPYMLRESSTPTLARTIAVLPNLRYVDLPEGLFVDDPAYLTLKLEVQARCPDLRKMTYMGGSERSLEALGRGNVWTKLEVLELARINMDPATLRQVLAVLQDLRALKVSDCRMLDDDIFRYNDVLQAFPPLVELILKDTPRVTSDGLVAYLSKGDAQNTLKVLSLTNTGIHPSTLHDILGRAPHITALSITEEVDSAFPSQAGPIPPLTNWSLQSLRFEITASPTNSPYASITAGYYNYLASSLFAGGLPRLAEVYVRDQNFPDMLLGLPPPVPGFAGSHQRPSSSSSANMFSMGSGNLSARSPSTLSPSSTGGRNNPTSRFSSNNPFASAASNVPRGPGILSLNQTLEVYTKGEDDLDWGSIRMDPFDAYDGAGNGSRGRHGRNGSAASGRPMSSYGLADAGAGWQAGHGARKSVVVQGNGNGGFLAVPGDAGHGAHGRKGSTVSVGGAREDLWPRPTSSAGPKKGARDLWR
ncbi:Uu.00g092510.m01.CDS01 [Anthostomella pinea]|uniref:Uu.00g092510.m01.CDS01 n=1 Tax=Anthostomella pinea TaxID=933095 RepID=A0AAI8VPH1_9PEZI|nr:Uu.00g092510.m01.CDS01 [Anthostomella pinea]